MQATMHANSSRQRLTSLPTSGFRSPHLKRSENRQFLGVSQSSRPSTGSALAGVSTIIREKHRVVVLGSAKTGKSQIISQFLYDKYNSRYRQTIEELHRADYELPDGSSLTLDILDTSGAYAFPAMRNLAISTGNAFILVYSYDDEESWNEVARLREQIIEKRGPRVAIVIVGNKSDLQAEERQVQSELTETISSVDWECGHVECSAKDNIGVMDVFKELLVQAKIRYNLSPAVRRRRMSLPTLVTTQRHPDKILLKRHSCTLS